MTLSTPAQPAPQTAKLPGVIDTLSTAYRTLNRHPYLLLLPVALDFFYWLGPRLSAEPVAHQAGQALEEIIDSPAAGGAGSQSVQSLAMLRGILEAVQSLNLFAVLSGSLSLPSWLLGQDLRPPAGMGWGGAISIATGTDLLRLLAALFVAGVIVGAMFRSLAAQVVRDGHVQAAGLAQRALAGAMRFMLLVVTLVVAALVFGLPLTLLMGVLTLLSPLLGSLFLVAVWAWFYLYTFFTLDALFISEVGPLKAIRNSVTVVRLSTSSTLGLFLTILLISLGMPLVWSALGTSEVATIVAIVGNAYIGTGMIIASMTFYRDRVTKR
jgi:hypothetical protein